MMPIYKEYRCSVCNKLLFKGLLVESEVEIKCKRCSTLNVFNGVTSDSLICFMPDCPRRVTQVTKKAEDRHT